MTQLSVATRKPNGSAEPPQSSILSHTSSHTSTLEYIRRSSSRFRSSPSSSPDTFSTPFDLLQELSTNREEYASDEVQLTAYKFPGSLLMVIDQTRQQVPLTSTSSRPGRNPTINACLSHGVGILSQHKDIKAIFKLRSQLLEMLNGPNGRSKDVQLAKEIWNIFERFLWVGHDSETRKQGLHLPEKLKQAVFAVKSDLGLSLDSIVILCIQLALHDQEWIHPEQQEEMKQSCDKFFRMMRVRRRMFEVLLAELEK